MQAKIIAVFAALVLLAGCASSGGTREEAAVVDADKSATVAQADTRNNKDMRCKRVKKTGSHRSELVCTDRNQSAEEARRTQDSLNRNNVRNSGCVSCGGDG